MLLATGDRRLVSRHLAAGTLVTLGIGLGLTQLLGGAYAETTWEPVALVALALALAVAVGDRRGIPLILLAPLLGLWLWSLASSAWSDSADAARVGANRWLLYAAVATLAGWALRDQRRRAIALLGGVAMGVLAVAAWMLVRMLTGHGPALFLGTRLNDPLGYVNGQGAYLLAAVAPCLALAEWRGAPLAPVGAAAGLAGTVVLTGIGLLAQSRSWMVASAVTVVVLLAAVPGRRRRAGVLLLTALAIATVYRPLAHVWRVPNLRTGVVTATTTKHAAVAIILAGLAAALIWFAVTMTLERLASRAPKMRSKATRALSLLLGILVLSGAVLVAFNAGTIARRVSAQYRAFVHLAPSTGSTRLFTGAGNRYDYWRVAWQEFTSAPLDGVGAGNYQPGYYLHRRTTESIAQPHSLELQTLAELGVLGGVMLALLVAAIASGLAGTARAGRGDPIARAVAVGAGGTFTAWLVQTSVDWMHLIPGLTAIALVAATALIIRPARQPSPLQASRRIATVAMAVVVVCAGAVFVAPRILALRSQSAAQNALARSAARATIVDASRALAYDPSSVQALDLRAAGFARLNAFAPARADLQRAIAAEPHNWVTWALLGDLLTRRGDFAGARAAYGRAHQLDPRDPMLLSAASQPAGTGRRRLH